MIAATNKSKSEKFEGLPLTQQKETILKQKCFHKTKQEHNGKLSFPAEQALNQKKQFYSGQRKQVVVLGMQIIFSRGLTEYKTQGNIK
jgi:hypothetical protein